MIFSDPTNKLGIIQDITSKTNATLTDYLIDDRTRDINNAYSRVAFLIFQADGRMQWDDTNATDQPITETDLVNGQEDYNLFDSAPDALQDWLSIETVEMKNPDDLATLLTPIDRKNIGVAWSEYRKIDGIPTVYDFNGTSILLKPNPNYNSTKGLKVYFNRAPQYFSASDTTKRPGFAVIFHKYLSLAPSYEWARDKGLPNKNDLKRDLDAMEKAIQEHYSRRNKTEKPVLRRAFKSYK